jgi:hypothetical protein
MIDLRRMLATERVWLVDWDDAVLATPELDLMCLLGATYGSEWIGDRERTWLARGYLDSRAATASDLVRAANPASRFVAAELASTGLLALAGY